MARCSNQLQDMGIPNEDDPDQVEGEIGTSFGGFADDLEIPSMDDGIIS